MNREVQAIRRNLEQVLNGEPWYGRPVYAILGEVDESQAFHKPAPNAHSLTELLYHMITWADFTLQRLNKNKESDLKTSEELDWRTIDPNVHSWKKGMEEYRRIHDRILAILDEKDDDFLNEIVDERQYNFRFLLNGLVQHNIYHLGQVAYVRKMLG
ncbi:MAG TPA: DinB family protein [Chitinophagaceae bacterium]|nr:DinB family protein [Chitinophagaceae bacterium]